jgi:hypothetical protein
VGGQAVLTIEYTDYKVKTTATAQSPPATAEL